MYARGVFVCCQYEVPVQCTVSHVPSDGRPDGNLGGDAGGASGWLLVRLPWYELHGYEYEYCYHDCCNLYKAELYERLQQYTDSSSTAHVGPSTDPLTLISEIFSTGVIS